MNDSAHDLLPRLVPPAGGFERLLRRRDAQPAPERPWVWSAAACGGTCAALLVFTLQPTLPHTPALDRLRDVRATQTPLTLDDAHALQIAARPGVRVYWTASLADASTPEQPATSPLPW